MSKDKRKNHFEAKKENYEVAGRSLPCLFSHRNTPKIFDDQYQYFALAKAYRPGDHCVFIPHSEAAIAFPVVPNFSEAPAGEIKADRVHGDELQLLQYLKACEKFYSPSKVEVYKENNGTIAGKTKTPRQQYLPYVGTVIAKNHQGQQTTLLLMNPQIEDKNHAQGRAKKRKKMRSITEILQSIPVQEKSEKNISATITTDDLQKGHKKRRSSLSSLFANCSAKEIARAVLPQDQFNKNKEFHFCHGHGRFINGNDNTENITVEAAVSNRNDYHLSENPGAAVLKKVGAGELTLNCHTSVLTDKNGNFTHVGDHKSRTWQDAKGNSVTFESSCLATNPATYETHIVSKKIHEQVLKPLSSSPDKASAQKKSQRSLLSALNTTFFKAHPSSSSLKTHLLHKNKRNNLRLSSA